MNRHLRSQRLLIWGLAIALLAGLFWLWFADPPFASLSQETIEGWVEKSGVWGPLVVVVVMTVAVVVSPLPSAPIAIAAGAAYGHTLGTALVALGAEFGAVIAFVLARVLGRDAVRRLIGEKLDMGLLGSQNALMLTVFLSRLLPFVSFDLMSYAAGVTALQTWRFAVATLAGILPASFVLAHLGSEVASENGSGFVGLVLGLFVAFPLLWASWHRSVQTKQKG